MARRWLRNHATADMQEQVQAIFWFLRRCCQFIIVDFSSSGHFAAVTEATDGILNAATPARFAKLTTNPYAFTAADIGRRLALRDTTTPKNSGIYTITSIVDVNTVNLNSPVANFSGLSTNVGWTLFQNSAKPPLDAWFVVQSPNSIQWQARIIANSLTYPGNVGLAVELGAFGGWNTTTNVWDLPVSGVVNLHQTVAQTFAIADETLGGFFIWSEDGLPNRTGVMCSEIAGIHAPQGVAIPHDDSHVALLGASGVAPGTLNRLLSGPSAGFATDGFMSLPDKSGYTNAFVHQWRRIADGFDIMSVPGGAIDPRSGNGDSYQFVAYQNGPFFHVRGFVPLLRMVHDGHANKTLLNSGSVYVVQAGIGLEWDGSTPI